MLKKYKDRVGVEGDRAWEWECPAFNKTLQNIPPLLPTTIKNQIHAQILILWRKKG